MPVNPLPPLPAISLPYLPLRSAPSLPSLSPRPLTSPPLCPAPSLPHPFVPPPHCPSPPRASRCSRAPQQLSPSVLIRALTSRAPFSLFLPPPNLDVLSTLIHLRLRTTAEGWGAVGVVTNGGARDSKNTLGSATANVGRVFAQRRATARRRAMLFAYAGAPGTIFFYSRKRK